jgi:hypothetical protein
VLGVAGVLAGGYAASASRPDSPALVPVQAVPAAESTDAWAQRATVALASVNRQLDTLARAEEEWQRQPESRRSAPPAAVGALQERRSVLQRRRATLQSQLDAYRSLRATQLDLAESEQHLQAVEKALTDVPSGRRYSTEQAAAIAALDEQRDLRVRQRDAQRTELDSLKEGVSAAARTPLPDDDASTDAVSKDVLEAVRGGGRTREPRDDPDPPRPDVVAGRQQEDGKPRQEVGTSGPPDPRGPRDESEERRKAKERAEKKDSAEKEEDTLAQLRTRVAQAAREARRAEVERKPEARLHRDAGASTSDGPSEAAGAEKVEGPTQHERRSVERPARVEAGTEDRQEGADDSDADDDRIEKRNARAAEKARHRSAAGGAEERRQPGNEKRPADEERTQKKHSSDKKHSYDKQSSATKRSSDEERSADEKHSLDEKRSSGEERSGHQKHASDEKRPAEKERSSHEERSSQEHSSKTKRSSRKELSSDEKRSSDDKHSSEKKAVVGEEVRRAAIVALIVRRQ